MAPGEPSFSMGQPSTSAPRRGGKVRIALIVVVVGGLVGTLVWLVLSDGSTRGGPPAPARVSTGEAAVLRTDVAERKQFSGSLARAGTQIVVAPATGTLTRARDIGQVVVEGQSLYEVDGRPVLLLYGKRPVWRAFSWGMSPGPDVQQLEAALNALGHGPELAVDQQFTTGTSAAIRRWQAASGLPVTGTVPLGQVVFLPRGVRITGHSVELGTQVQEGSTVETATTGKPVVIVQLPPADLPTTKVGDPVEVSLPDGRTQRPGRIIAIGAVATTSSSSSGSGPDPDSGSDSGGGESTAQVTIAVDGAIKGFLDQAQVQVFITAELHRDVLAVPVVSLRAQPDGQYEVIVVDGDSTRQVPVSVGLFDDIARLAEVSGPGLTEGLRIEVPSGTS
jgi:peptidoglycan hydrolase-like protein with peptidoglycan-binding domain